MNSDSSAANVQAEGVAKSPENDNQQALAMLQKSDFGDGSRARRFDLPVDP